MIKSSTLLILPIRSKATRKSKRSVLDWHGNYGSCRDLCCRIGSGFIGPFFRLDCQDPLGPLGGTHSVKGRPGKPAQAGRVSVDGGN